jgi:hypothetical protein
MSDRIWKGQMMSQLEILQQEVKLLKKHLPKLRSFNLKATGNDYTLSKILLDSMEEQIKFKNKQIRELEKPTNE